jgi:hypothetical protein
MSNPVWVEIPIFVHGITSDENPGSHHQQYEGLLRLINVALRRKGKPQFDQPLIGVEWGWDSGISIENDRYLAAAELAIGHQLLAQEQAHTDVTLNPARLVHAIIRGSSRSASPISSTMSPRMARLLFAIMFSNA